MLTFLQNKSKLLYLSQFIFVSFFIPLALQKTHYPTIELKIPTKESLTNVRNIIYIDNFPVKAGYVSSRYGIRKDPFSGKHKMHSGLDIAAKSGSKIQPLGLRKGDFFR